MSKIKNTKGQYDRTDRIGLGKVPCIAINPGSISSTGCDSWRTNRGHWWEQNQEGPMSTSRCGSKLLPPLLKGKETKKRIYTYYWKERKNWATDCFKKSHTDAGNKIESSE